jgi:hypothetical protein
MGAPVPESIKLIRFPVEPGGQARTGSTDHYYDPVKQELQFTGAAATAGWEQIGVSPTKHYVWTGSGTAASARQSSSLDLLATARDLYLEAFTTFVGKAAPAELFEVSSDGDCYWRLTFMVPTELTSDVTKLVAAESEMHNFVRKLAPDLAGFFSIQFSDDGQS